MRRPGTLLAGAAIVALEGLVALALSLYFAFGTITGSAGNLTMAVAEIVFFAAVGAGLLWVAWGGLLKLERWGRAPSVITQLFMLPIGYTMFQNDLPAIGAPLVAVALAGLGVLLAPPTTQALYDQDA
ncbi:hypothetical protein [Nonomuraea longicatena]|uniref:hypothetical protein n=1 Tax=Nonomuraea longicatena TaxID=83682 RepID=UPI0031E2BC71